MATYITTLKDATNTDALLPRTVLGAIADGNGNYLDDQMLASDLNALKNGKIADMSSKITSLSSTYTMNKWQDGSIDTTNGADYVYTGAIRYPYKVGIGTGVERLTCDLGYYFLLFAWDLNGTYIGAWKTDGTWSKVASGWKSLQDWNCHDYPDYVFKPVLLKTGIATTDYTHFQFAGLNGSQMGSIIPSIGAVNELYYLSSPSFGMSGNITVPNMNKYILLIVVLYVSSVSSSNRRTVVFPYSSLQDASKFVIPNGDSTTGVFRPIGFNSSTSSFTFESSLSIGISSVKGILPFA